MSVIRFLGLSSLVAALLLSVTARVYTAYYPAPTPKADPVGIYIPIACNSQIIGTGFPVASDLIMTAAHVHCLPEETQMVSLDGGLSWIADIKFQASSLDIAIITLNRTKNKKIVQFRKPTLGETIHAYGSSFGGLLSVGIIAQVRDQHIMMTNIPIPGMSGSAVVGEDNKVVGMLTEGIVDSRIGGIVAGGYPGDFLQQMVETFPRSK